MIKHFKMFFSCGLKIFLCLLIIIVCFNSHTCTYCTLSILLILLKLHILSVVVLFRFRSIFAIVAPWFREDCTLTYAIRQECIAYLAVLPMSLNLSYVLLLILCLFPNINCSKY